MKFLFGLLLVFAIAASTLALPGPNSEAETYWGGGWGREGGGWGRGWGGGGWGGGGWGREGGWGGGWGWGR